MCVVLDSSATLAWVYSEQTTEAIGQVFDLLSEGGAWVPGFWRLEVTNVLDMGVRRGRHDVTFRDATLADLALLPINLDAETDSQAWGATLQMAGRYRLMPRTWNSPFGAACHWPLSTGTYALPLKRKD
jgi:hypothetical protein